MSFGVIPSPGYSLYRVTGPIQGALTGSRLLREVWAPLDVTGIGERYIGVDVTGIGERYIGVDVTGIGERYIGVDVTGIGERYIGVDVTGIGERYIGVDVTGIGERYIGVDVTGIGERYIGVDVTGIGERYIGVDVTGIGERYIGVDVTGIGERYIGVTCSVCASPSLLPAPCCRLPISLSQSSQSVSLSLSLRKPLSLCFPIGSGFHSFPKMAAALARGFPARSQRAELREGPCCARLTPRPLYQLPPPPPSFHRSLNQSGACALPAAAAGRGTSASAGHVTPTWRR
ncbi:Hypothetical predicted protein [Pelobates cultripes]|uniref:Uncharacterized protein n=1 Tax=Pelobates cultripes TaxID=61616 RepID=A0AAD1T4R6_PELCU|nr:Hypothetical predicted protein [Pelobates cultripes]